MIDEIINLLPREKHVHFGEYEREILEGGGVVMGLNEEEASLLEGTPMGALKEINNIIGIPFSERVTNGKEIYNRKIALEIEDLVTYHPQLVKDIISDDRDISVLIKIRGLKEKNSSRLIVELDNGNYREKSKLLVTDKSILDYVLNEPEKLNRLHHRDFEYFIAELLCKLGYSSVEISPVGKDGGVDVYAHIEHALGKEIVIVQCKRYIGKKVGEPVVKQLLTDVELNMASKGIIATTSYLTKPASILVKSYSHKLISMDNVYINNLLKRLKL